MDGFKVDLSVVLLVVISILVFTSGFISASYELRDKNINGFWRSLTSSGKLVIVLTIATLVLTVAQFSYTSYTSAKELIKRDSIIRADYAKSVEGIRRAYSLSSDTLKKKYDSSTKDIIKALAQYGLKYDTAQKRIEKLVHDSLRTTPDPVLTFDDVPIEVKSDIIKGLAFTIHIVSRDAASRDFNINVATCESNALSGPYLNGINGRLFHFDGKLSTDQGATPTVYVIGSRFKKLIFFRVYGTYKSLKSDLQIRIDEVAVYNLETNSSYIVFGNTRLAVKQFLSKYINQ
jgi:hypothetical protein